MTMAPQGFDLLQFERVAFPGLTVAPVPNPAAGTDWTFEPSNGTLIRLAAVRALLTTSSHVANRAPELRLLTANGDIMLGIGSATLAVASGAISYNWARGLDTNSGGSGASSAPLPDMWLGPAATIKVVTVNLDPGDQWSAIVITYELAPYASR